MSLEKLTADLDIIQALVNEPNDVGGMTADQVKAKFDSAGNVIKDYINIILTEAIDNLDSANIKKTGDQNIDGIKTFVKSPIIPTPIINMQASTKKYVDDTDSSRKTYVDTTFEKPTDNHLGAWKGITDPTYADPGIAGVVAGHTAQLASNTKHSLNGAQVFSITAYPRIIPEANDLGRLQRAIADANEGSVLYLKDIPFFEMPSTLSINKKVHIIGNGVEFTSTTPGMDNTIEVTGVDGIIIAGIRFNQNLYGRTSLHLIDCPNFLVEGCYFTGYSKEYAYYQTDGGIKIENCKHGKIMFNTWENHGQQYSATDGLNRCITIQSASDDIFILGNTFNKVNQAIVTACGSIIVSGNTFIETHDNVLYVVEESKSVIFTGNLVKDIYDEAIVIGSGTLINASNTFENISNKAIAISIPSAGYKPIKITDTGNKYENSAPNSGQFLIWRLPTIQVDTYICKDNEYTSAIPCNFEYFNIGNVREFIFDGNILNCPTVSYQKIMYVTGDAYGDFKNNSITGSTSDTKALEVLASTNSLFYIQDNKLTGCRIVNNDKVVINNQEIFPSLAYIASRLNISTVYSSSIPTAGTWKAGDIAINTNATELGSAGSKYIIDRWRCSVAGTPGTWTQCRMLTGN